MMGRKTAQEYFVIESVVQMLLRLDPAATKKCAGSREGEKNSPFKLL